MQKQIIHFLCVSLALGFFSCNKSATAPTEDGGSSSGVVEASSSSLVASSSSSGVVSDWCATAGNCGTFTDDRESPAKTYQWTKIGTQTWMAENLNYIPSSGNSSCYGNEASNCATYGRLYDWETVMTGASSSDLIPSGVQGLCPTGWHVPSNAEWDTLENYAGGSDIAGTKLKANSSLWDTNTGTDDYGFSALPGGVYLKPLFYDVGKYGHWWSATKGFAVGAYVQTMDYDNANMSLDGRDPTSGYSLRCVKD